MSIAMSFSVSVANTIPSPSPWPTPSPIPNPHHHCHHHRRNIMHPPGTNGIPSTNNGYIAQYGRDRSQGYREQRCFCEEKREGDGDGRCKTGQLPRSVGYRRWFFRPLCRESVFASSARSGCNASRSSKSLQRFSSLSHYGRHPISFATTITITITILPQMVRLLDSVSLGKKRTGLYFAITMLLWKSQS